MAYDLPNVIAEVFGKVTDLKGSLFMIVDEVVETGRKRNDFAVTDSDDGTLSEGHDGMKSDNTLFRWRPNGVARDYLRFAIQRAVGSAESYRNAAQIVGGDRRGLLYFMAGHKNRQAISLKINDPDSGFSIFESGTNGTSGSVASYFIDTEFKPLDTLDEVFLFIFRKEHKSLDIYIKLAQLERDLEVRTLFLYLIQLQTEDIFRLESEFTKLSKREAENAVETDIPQMVCDE